MYDYIIVGAGSAGCVLANRLSENPKTSVLVLEAGGKDDVPEIHDPTTAVSLFQTAVDWGYLTEEEPSLHNRQLYWPRGKVLGGSSSTNFMLYVRGSHANYEHWHELGNSGWGYKDVLPYFKKAEDREYGDSAYHGKGGPLAVMDLPGVNPLTAAFLAAGEELGWSRTDDYNGEVQEGFGVLQHTIRQGKRHSTAVGYLHPIENRSNVTVWTNVLATRVLFEGTRAIGVAYVKDGEECQVLARQEVILSAGAINSPQTLMLSGVGPAEHLREHGINVVVDLPGVGHNLQDHPCIFTFSSIKPDFEQFGNIPEGIAYIKTRADLAEPDIQLLTAPFFFPPIIPGNGHTIALTLVDPKSRGQLKLRSANPTEHPILIANYLTDPTDLQTLVDGMKVVRSLNQSQAFAPFYEGEVEPGLHVQSDEEIREYIRTHLQSIYHPVGTCKMGHDKLAVVDEQLRVHGVEGLRVVDASIMPTIVNGNTNAPTIMIAEKIADQISRQ